MNWWKIGAGVLVTVEVIHIYVTWKLIRYVNVVVD